MKEELIAKIIEIEWKMFESVPNEGGKAPCQQDFTTFRIMRKSQLMTWSEATLQSYLENLISAEKSGRNLMTEKYARMMASTAPGEYQKIKHLLPPLSEEVLSLIEKIVEINLEWQVEVAKRFPYLHKKGRPIYSFEDTSDVVSFETYLRGELATYSQKTLELYYKHVLWQKENQINGAEMVLLNMVKEYGFKSLDEANEVLKKRLNG